MTPSLRIGEISRKLAGLVCILCLLAFGAFAQTGGGSAGTQGLTPAQAAANAAGDAAKSATSARKAADDARKAADDARKAANAARAANAQGADTSTLAVAVNAAVWAAGSASFAADAAEHAAFAAKSSAFYADEPAAVASAKSAADAAAAAQVSADAAKSAANAAKAAAGGAANAAANQQPSAPGANQPNPPANNQGTPQPKPAGAKPAQAAPNQTPSAPGTNQPGPPASKAGTTQPNPAGATPAQAAATAYTAARGSGAGPNASKNVAYTAARAAGASPNDALTAANEADKAYAAYAAYGAPANQGVWNLTPAQAAYNAARANGAGPNAARSDAYDAARAAGAAPFDALAAANEADKAYAANQAGGTGTNAPSNPANGAGATQPNPTGATPAQPARNQQPSAPGTNQPSPPASKAGTTQPNQAGVTPGQAAANAYNSTIANGGSRNDAFFAAYNAALEITRRSGVGEFTAELNAHDAAAAAEAAATQQPAVPGANQPSSPANNQGTNQPNPAGPTPGQAAPTQQAGAASRTPEQAAHDAGLANPTGVAKPGEWLKLWGVDELMVDGGTWTMSGDGTFTVTSATETKTVTNTNNPDGTSTYTATVTDAKGNIVRQKVYLHGKDGSVTISAGSPDGFGWRLFHLWKYWYKPDGSKAYQVDGGAFYAPDASALQNAVNKEIDKWKDLPPPQGLQWEAATTPAGQPGSATSPQQPPGKNEAGAVTPNPSTPSPEKLPGQQSSMVPASGPATLAAGATLVPLGASYVTAIVAPGTTIEAQQPGVAVVATGTVATAEVVNPGDRVDASRVISMVFNNGIGIIFSALPSHQAAPPISATVGSTELLSQTHPEPLPVTNGNATLCVTSSQPFATPAIATDTATITPTTTYAVMLNQSGQKVGQVSDFSGLPTQPEANYSVVTKDPTGAILKQAKITGGTFNGSPMASFDKPIYKSGQKGSLFISNQENYQRMVEMTRFGGGASLPNEPIRLMPLSDVKLPSAVSFNTKKVPIVAGRPGELQAAVYYPKSVPPNRLAETGNNEIQKQANKAFEEWLNKFPQSTKTGQKP